MKKSENMSQPAWQGALPAWQGALPATALQGARPASLEGSRARSRALVSDRHRVPGRDADGRRVGQDPVGHCV